MDAPTNPRRIGISELEARTGVERSTLYRWYKAGKLPAPHYLGERRVWFVAEIEAWEARRMAEQAAGRRGARNLVGAPPAAGEQAP